MKSELYIIRIVYIRIYSIKEKFLCVDEIRIIHFIKEKFDGNIIKLEYVPTSQQLADILTKGLSEQTHEFLEGKLGLINIYSQAWGGVWMKSELYIIRIVYIRIYII